MNNDACTAFTVITLIFDVIIFLTLSRITYKFIRHGLNQESPSNANISSEVIQKSKRLRFVGKFFNVWTIIAIISCIVYVSTICSDGLSDDGKPIDTTPRTIFNAVYAVQILLMLISWFSRLHFSFNHTPHQLSKWCIFMFIFTLSLMLISVFLMMMNVHNIYNLGSMLLLILIGLYVSLVCGTSFLYVYKLSIIYRQSDFDTDFAILITKIVLLNFISLFITIITGSSLAFRNDSMLTTFIAAIFSTIDIFSNCICIMLSYSDYRQYYDKILGSLHHKCENCWKNVSRIQDRKQLSNSVKMDHANSNSSNLSDVEFSI